MFSLLSLAQRLAHSGSYRRSSELGQMSKWEEVLGLRSCSSYVPSTFLNTSGRPGQGLGGREAHSGLGGCPASTRAVHAQPSWGHSAPSPHSHKAVPSPTPHFPAVETAWRLREPGSLQTRTWRGLELSPAGPPKQQQFQKNIYVCFIDCTKAFDCVHHSKLWKILKEMGIPDHFTCLLRNLYVAQEAAVRTGCGTTYWFQIGKGVCQGCILSSCSLNFYAEYIM